MSVHMPRRAFLGHLTRLPLVGGAVTLAGAPSAVAEPVTPDMLRCYFGWLAWEHERLGAELYGERGREMVRQLPRTGPAFDWHRGSFPHTLQWESAEPSARAALVLAAVGCDWTGAQL